MPCFLALGVILAPLQSCGDNRFDSDCDRIQSVTYVAVTPQLVRENALDKEASIAASNQQRVLSDQLVQIPILDQALSHYRDELVTLYRHDSDLSLQVTAFMTDSGEIKVAGGNRTAYEQVAAQRIAIGRQVQHIHNHIAGYCGSSEF